MKKLIQLFRNIRMSVKLLVSYAIIVALAIIGIGIILYSFVQRQLTTQYAQFADSALQMTCETLRDRCIRSERSAEYLMTDLNVIQIVNSVSYISEYQRSYDVNQILDPTIVKATEQNVIIDSIRFYTYGEIKGLREGYLDIEENADSPWLTRSEVPLWKYSDGQIAICGGIVNVLSPERSATMVMFLDGEKLFEGLFPAIEYDCSMRIADADGNDLYSINRISDEQSWHKNKEGHQIFSKSVDVNGWSVSFEFSGSDVASASAGLYRALILVASLVVLMMAAVSVVFSVSISSRVTRLCNQLGTIVENDYQNDIRSDDKDEIGIITNTVGGMVSKTREMIRERYQEEIDRKNLQVRALQAQINPHFLYNTLSNLNWRAIDRNDMEMSNILTELSQFYRLSLNGGKMISTIGQELEHVKTYVRIQCAIRNTRLKEEVYDVDQSLLNCLIPGIILQPIVENALGHGIGAIGYENGELRVFVGIENEKIVIKVSDNGPGVSKEITDHIFDTDSKIGYGLRNVNLRLKLLFGEESRMYFAPVEHGSVAVLELPPISSNPEWLSEDM